MKLADAKRLKPGEEITFGDHTYTAKCTKFWRGEVIRVTPRGGILVKVIDEQPWYGEEDYKRRFGNPERWVAYSHAMPPR